MKRPCIEFIKTRAQFLISREFNRLPFSVNNNNELENFHFRFYPSVLVLIALCCFSFISLNINASNIYKKYSVFQCDSLIKANVNNPNFVIIDVRTPGEYLPDHLKGAINRNSADPDLIAKLNLLPKSKIYLIHCASGTRSASVLSKMQSQAFSEVYEMIGGISAWRNAFRPTVSTFEPRLMLLSAKEITKGAVLGKKDTFIISITNRANDNLVFSSILFNNSNEFISDFNTKLQLAGAEDFTFTVIYTPSVVILDTLNISLDSNDGVLFIHIPVKKGNILSSKNLSVNKTQIYPNPARDKINVYTCSEGEISQLKIIDITGKVVLESIFRDNKKEIDISGLNNGIYILNVKGRFNFSEKLIVNR